MIGKDLTYKRYNCFLKKVTIVTSNRSKFRMDINTEINCQHKGKTRYQENIKKRVAKNL